MKKSAIVILAVLVVVASLIGGTMALYTKDLGTVNSGSVVAKEFILVGETTEAFGTDVKIAPTETVESVFTISNNDGTTTSEVDMDVVVTLTFTSTITPLTIKVNDGTSDVLTAAGNYTFNFTKDVAATKTFTVTVEWPETANDIDFVDGTASYTISVTGSQKV